MASLWCRQERHDQCWGRDAPMTDHPDTAPLCPCECHGSKRWRSSSLSPTVRAWVTDIQPAIAKAERRAREAKATADREWRERQEGSDE